jgi:hypothetical protein
LTTFAKSLSKETTGVVGEALSVAKNSLRGNRLLGTQVPIPTQTTVADSYWQSLNGTRYYVESKFGTSGLTPAQRRAAAALGNAYRVERWRYPFVEKVGSVAGGVGGGAAGGLLPNHRCGCK